MVQEIIDEVEQAIYEAFLKCAKENYNPYILLIGRADIIPGLKSVAKTDCVVDYQLDRYHDETREGFYLRYMNRNYVRDGFSYEGESGLDDLSIEMMIYTHLWESECFLKSLYRLSKIVVGDDYPWELPKKRKWDFMHKEIVEPLKSKNLSLGSIVVNAYSSDLRNSFAHSLYNVDTEKREIYLRTEREHHKITFKDFQGKFLRSVILMNRLENHLNIDHNKAATLNTAITEPFFTPDGVKVQIYGKEIERSGKMYPEFRMVAVKEQLKI